MKRPFVLWCIFSAGLSLAGGSWAAIIFDNGLPDRAGHGSEMTHWIEADDFTLTEPARIETITFWDIETTGRFSSTVVWQIYANSPSGGPGALLYSGAVTDANHVATGFFVDSRQEYVTTINIVPASLPRGTYWLGLHNGLLSNTQNLNVYWETTDTGSGLASQHRIAPFNGSWFTNAFPPLPPDFAFRLEGAVAPKLEGVGNKGGVPWLSFTTAHGYNYRVDYKTGVGDQRWTPLSGAENLVGTGELVQVSDHSANAGSHRFYRVSLAYDTSITPAIATFGVENSHPQISFATAIGYYYSLEFKNDLSDASWQPVTRAETIRGTGDIVSITDPDIDTTTQGRRFYRVVIF